MSWFILSLGMLLTADQEPGIDLPNRKNSTAVKLADAEVVLIGLDNYGAISQRCDLPSALSWPVADIEGFKTLLGARAHMLPNEKANQDAIRQLFRNLAAASKARPFPLLIVIWSGHGVYCDGRYYVHCFDGLMAVDELKQLIDRVKAKGLLFALDACYAGGFVDKVGTSWQNSLDGQVTYLLSATNKQTAKDRGFFQELLDGLNGLAIEHLDLDEVPQISLQAAFDYADRRLGGQKPLWIGPSLPALRFPVRSDQLDVRFHASEPPAEAWPKRLMVSRTLGLEVRIPTLIEKAELPITSMSFVYKEKKRDPTRVAMQRLAPQLFRLEMRATSLPLGSLQYWFLIEYGDRRTIATLKRQLTVSPEP